MRFEMIWYCLWQAIHSTVAIAQEVGSCPNGITTVVEYPVFINTYIAENTTLLINGGIEITINNAPTTVYTVTKAETVFVPPCNPVLLHPLR